MSEAGDRRRFASGTQTNRWLLLGTMIAAAGIALSIYGSIVDAQRQATRDEGEFLRNATEVSDAVEEAINQQSDLVMSVAAYLSADRDANQQQFTTWVASARVAQRHPDVFGLGLVVPVRTDELGRFAGLAPGPEGGLLAGVPGTIEPIAPARSTASAGSLSSGTARCSSRRSTGVQTRHSPGRPEHPPSSHRRLWKFSATW